MSFHNVFNPERGIDPKLGFNANWNYGSPRKSANNIQIQRPRLGTWSTREVTNAGYSFTLTFTDRPIAQVQYIRHFYQSFKFGFFTLIDHDNSAREHVGRFTTYSDDTQKANLKYSVQVTFEEIPQAPMRNYPSNWAHESFWQPAVDDFGSFLAAPSNPATIAQTVPGSKGPLPWPQELYLAAANQGDFIQTQYVGWGFRLTLRPDVALGYVNLFVDGVLLLTDLDPAQPAEGNPGVHKPMVPSNGGTAINPISAIVSGGATGSNIPTSVLVQNLPLDAHLVKLVSAGGGSGTGSDLIFPAIEVMG